MPISTVMPFGPGGLSQPQPSTDEPKEVEKPAISTYAKPSNTRHIASTIRSMETSLEDLVLGLLNLPLTPGPNDIPTLLLKLQRCNYLLEIARLYLLNIKDDIGE